MQIMHISTSQPYIASLNLSGPISDNDEVQIKDTNSDSEEEI